MIIRSLRNASSRHLDCCRAEPLESRQLFSVAIPDGYEWVQTISAPASNSAKNGPETVATTEVLKPGASYFLVATGKYKLANTPVVRYGDAGFYQHRDAPHDWLPSVRGTNLRIDGVTDWGDLNEDSNEYSATIVGDGTKLQAAILDSNYSDNGGSLSLAVYEYLPWVTVASSDTAAEQDETTGAFTISRDSANVANDLSVYFNLGGSADNYELKRADTGEEVFGSVTIEAGETSAVLLVSPTDDDESEWTESVDLTLVEEGYPYFVDGTAAATVQIVDNDDPDVEINEVVDGAENDVGALLPLDGPRRRVSLGGPTDAKDGASFTLENAEPNRVLIFDSESGGSPLAASGSQTWDAGSQPTEVWLEGVAIGSEYGNGVQLSWQGTDSPATTRPSDPYAELKAGVFSIKRVEQPLWENAMWYFAGWNPQNYLTQATYKAIGDLGLVAGGSQTWTVTRNDHLIALENGLDSVTKVIAGANVSVGVIATDYSSEGDGPDTQIQLRFTKQLAVNQVNTSSGTVDFPVLTAFSAEVTQKTAPVLVVGPAGSSGYIREMHFKVLDQYGTVLPRDIEGNEKFVGNMVLDDPNSNWGAPVADGEMQPANDQVDTAGMVAGAFNNKQPTTVAPNDPMANVPVQHILQEHRVGSVVPGEGVLVLSDTLQYYRGTADWLNITSP